MPPQIMRGSRGTSVGEVARRRPARRLNDAYGARDVWILLGRFDDRSRRPQSEAGAGRQACSEPPREPHGRVVLLMDVAGDVADALAVPSSWAIGALGVEGPQDVGVATPGRLVQRRPAVLVAVVQKVESGQRCNSGAQLRHVPPLLACLRAAAHSPNAGGASPRASATARWLLVLTDEFGLVLGRSAKASPASSILFQCRRKGGGPRIVHSSFSEKPDASFSSKSGGTIVSRPHRPVPVLSGEPVQEHAGVGAAHRLQARMILLRGLIITNLARFHS